MGKATGFAGQRIRVLAKPVIGEASRRPGTSALLVTDCGFFPHAADHLRHRPRGAEQAIVMVCTEGQGWCEMRGARHAVTPGNVAIIPPGEPHSYGADPHHPWTIWWAHIVGHDVPELLRATGCTANAPTVKVADVFALSGLVERALEMMERDVSPNSLLGASGAIWHLLALIPVNRRGNKDAPDPIRQVVKFLQDHVGQRYSVAELAEMAMMSPSHFAALFRRAVGTGVLQYQTSLRMIKARVLLDSTDLPIGSIARHTGYPDAFYFSRQFHATHGLSPTEYRAMDKG
jgi:AraC-like DNA-binding protein